MTKKRRRLNNDSEKTFTPHVMTEQGFMPAEKAIAAPPSAVHAPQVMTLSNNSTPPTRGTSELLKLYSDSPWLRAIVNKIGRSVGDTDWVIYAKKGSSGKYVYPDNILGKSGKIRDFELKRGIETNTLDKIFTHPLLEMLELGTGNPRLAGFAAMQVTQEHLELTGEAFWLIEKDEFQVPKYYWPIPPNWVIEFPTNKEPFYVLSFPGGQQVKIPITMIVPFIHADPKNPYGRGSGIAKSLDDEIQIDEFAAKHSKSFFLNRARPDIIVSGQFINQNDAKRLETQWLSDHQGFWKGFKPLFFSQKIDVKELSHSFESLQMVQMRKHERDTFISVFGAPPEKFGVIGESKRSTIAAADYFWNKDLIKPRLELIRRILQQVLVPQFDERIILYYDTPVIQDDEFQLQAMRQAPWTTTMNEWRKAQGQPSLGAAGEVVLIPLNHQIVPVVDKSKPIEGIDLSKPAASTNSDGKALTGPYYGPDYGAADMADLIAKEVVDVVTQRMSTIEDDLVSAVSSRMSTGVKALEKNRGD